MIAIFEQQLVIREHRALQVQQRPEIRFHALRQRSQIPADILLNLRERLHLTPREDK